MSRVTKEQLEVAKGNGLSRSTVHNRLTNGWSVERAISESIVHPTEAGRRGKEASNKKVKKDIAIGDTIQFERKGFVLQGKVSKVRDNSVIVDIDKKAQLALDLANAKTVVNHKNYTIIDNK